ncbi:hypothetical protein EIP86_001635 [Pleurotus ostreatoroseus]|nr:hypothetical protein EIP86_001635 [Pleurotus ostreatoroseus]
MSRAKSMEPVTDTTATDGNAVYDDEPGDNGKEHTNQQQSEDSHAEIQGAPGEIDQHKDTGAAVEKAPPRSDEHARARTVYNKDDKQRPQNRAAKSNRSRNPVDKPKKKATSGNTARETHRETDNISKPTSKLKLIKKPTNFSTYRSWKAIPGLDKSKISSLKKRIRDIREAHLIAGESWNNQPDERIREFLRAVKETCGKELAKYEDCWPAEATTRDSLINQRRRMQMLGLIKPDGSSAKDKKRSKSKTSSITSDRHDDGEEETSSEIEHASNGEGPSHRSNHSQRSKSVSSRDNVTEDKVDDQVEQSDYEPSEAAESPDNSQSTHAVIANAHKRTRSEEHTADNRPRKMRYNKRIDTDHDGRELMGLFDDEEMVNALLQGGIYTTKQILKMANWKPKNFRYTLEDMGLTKYQVGMVIHELEQMEE